MKIPFVGPAYVDRSVRANYARCINYYLEVDRQAKQPLALYGTPGLTTKATATAASVVRGMRVVGSNLYVVSGSKLYRYNTSYAETELGTLNTSTGVVSMADNLTQLMLVDGTDGYIVTLSSGAFAVISDGDFPANPVRVDFIDSYFIVNNSGTQDFYISSLADGSTWDALDTAAKEGFPDDIVSLIADHRELWLFGERSTEVWANTGNPDFPFERISGAFIEHGIAGAHCVTKADNSVFWLGADDRGRGIIWRANGYSPVRVSTHAIETAIQGYSTISDCIAFTQQQDGHTFVWFTFPTADVTWVYDAAASADMGMPVWHQRAYTNPGDGVFKRHRANAYAFFNGEHIVGDHTNGKLYELDLAVYADAGDTLTSLRGSPHIWDKEDQARMFHHHLHIDIEAGVGLVSGTGSDPQIQLRWSDDGGHTWSSWHYADIGSFAAIGSVGEYKKRARWNRLGSARDRIYETQTTDPVKRVIVGATLHATKGTS